MATAAMEAENKRLVAEQSVLGQKCESQGLGRYISRPLPICVDSGLIRRRVPRRRHGLGHGDGPQPGNGQASTRGLRGHTRGAVHEPEQRGISTHVLRQLPAPAEHQRPLFCQLGPSGCSITIREGTHHILLPRRFPGQTR